MLQHAHLPARTHTVLIRTYTIRCWLHTLPWLAIYDLKLTVAWEGSSGGAAVVAVDSRGLAVAGD